jgi:hypothetical protein
VSLFLLQILQQFNLFTCLPVNPWQMTRVFLSIHTLAVEDIQRAPVVARAWLKPAKTRRAEAAAAMIKTDCLFERCAEHGAASREDPVG